MTDKILPTRDTAIAVRPESLPTPVGKSEKRELRTDRSKTFLHPEKAADGKEIRTCQVQMGAVCYRDDNGEMRSIDTTVRDLDGEIGVDWAPYRFRLHSTGVGFDFTSREGGEVSIKLTGIGGEKFDDQAALKPDITDNVITFKDVRPGCDIVFKCLNGSVKTLRILHDASAPRTFEWRCESDRPELVDSALTGTDAAGNRLDLVSDVDRGVIRESWSGQVATIRDATTRIKSLASDVTYPVEIDPTVNASVVANADDGFELVGSFWSGNGTYIYFGEQSANVYQGGVRFSGLTVDQAATITSATFTVYCRFRNGSAAGNVFAWASDNAAVFDTTNRPSGVTKTTASGPIGPVTATATSFTSDVTAVVQEIVNRAGWVSGNAISLAMIESVANGNRAIFDAKEKGSGNTPTLSITYTAAASGAPQNLLLLGCG